MARGAAGRLVRPPQRLAPGWRPELAQDAADVHASGFRLIYSSAPIWAFVRPAASSSTANSRPVSPCGARVSAGGGVLMTPAAGDRSGIQARSASRGTCDSSGVWPSPAAAAARSAAAAAVASCPASRCSWACAARKLDRIVGLPFRLNG